MPLARFHLSVMDCLYVGLRASPGWNREQLIDLIASAMHACALRLKVGA